MPIESNTDRISHLVRSSGRGWITFHHKSVWDSHTPSGHLHCRQESGLSDSHVDLDGRPRCRMLDGHHNHPTMTTGYPSSCRSPLPLLVMPATSPPHQGLGTPTPLLTPKSPGTSPSSSSSSSVSSFTTVKQEAQVCMTYRPDHHHQVVPTSKRQRVSTKGARAKKFKSRSLDEGIKLQSPDEPVRKQRSLDENRLGGE